MTNVNKNNNKSKFELVKEINNAGITIEYLYIEGIKCGTIGYGSKADRKAAIDTIQKIVDNSTKEGMELVMEVINTITMGASMEEEVINANEAEEVIINHESFIIDYDGQVAYRINGGELKEYVDLNDIEFYMPDEAVKALLVERIKNKKREEELEAIRNNQDEDDWDDDEDDDDYDSYWDC